MTNRPSNHVGGENPQTPTTSPFAETKGGDSYRIPTDTGSSGGGATPVPARVTQKRLLEILPTLSTRDKDILSGLRHCRYLLTRQVQRLYFTDAETESAGLRSANRILDRLRDLGLASTLSRRIGGVRAGSSSLIWYLSSAGERLLRLEDDGPHARRRFMEPSSHFLAHTLAVAECYVQLTEICDSEKLKLIRTEMETDCWRSFSHRGRQTTLRPDLFAVTNCEDYEDRWFFEVDLKSEAPVTVVEKCRRYHEYYQSGLEQKLHGVFPLAVWIVPDTARRDSIVSHIRAEFVALPKIFVVILPDELDPLIRQGVEGGGLC